jgi:TPP-dependent pyruvate/acetoin dehydrogenase alpha subunit
MHFGEWERGVFPMVSHLPDSWPIAVGIAHAGTLEGRPRAVLAFCGDGATSTGLWHETLNFAAVFKTPNVFVIENNQYAYSTPTRRQYAIERLADRGAAYGIPAVQVDGNDALAVFEATTLAARRARAGEGPSLIEAMTMRIDGHAVHDGADYVPRELLEEWRRRDPIDRLRAELLEVGVAEAELDAVRASAVRIVDEAVDQAEAAAEPDPAGVTDGVFALPASGG